MVGNGRVKRGRMGVEREKRGDMSVPHFVPFLVHAAGLFDRPPSKWMCMCT